MQLLRYTCAFALLVIFLAGCKKTDHPEPGTGTFIDLGFIPAAVSAGADIAAFQSAIYNKGHVFVATSDGIWKSNLSQKQWSRSGLEGRIITAIYKHPTIEDRFFAGTRSTGKADSKTLYISTNGGTTWQPAAETIFNSLDNVYEEFACFAVRPNHPDVVYANLDGGTMIAVSTDGGQHWVRKNNDRESYFGYKAAIAFLPGNPDRLFQGAESPLDIAWLGSYDIDNTDPVKLSELTMIVNADVWGNRRPNELQSYSFAPQSLYVGQEGALSKVTNGTVKEIFKAEDSDNTPFPYSYITAIWVDPTDTGHILFGGSLNHNVQPMSLYETVNEGATIKRFEDKLGLENPEVREIVATDTFPAIVLNDQNANKVKLVLYKPK
jgi:hypothetical protein